MEHEIPAQVIRFINEDMNSDNPDRTWKRFALVKMNRHRENEAELEDALLARQFYDLSIKPNENTLKRFELHCKRDASHPASILVSVPANVISGSGDSEAAYSAYEPERVVVVEKPSSVAVECVSATEEVITKKLEPLSERIAKFRKSQASSITEDSDSSSSSSSSDDDDDDDEYDVKYNVGAHADLTSNPIFNEFKHSLRKIQFDEQKWSAFKQKEEEMLTSPLRVFDITVNIDV